MNKYNTISNKYNTINNKLNGLLKNPLHIRKDKFWYMDPSVIFNYQRIDEFFPSSDMTIEEQLNSFVRLSIYLSVILYLYTFNINYLYIFIITLIFTYLIYTYSNINTKVENYENNKSKIITPTLNNPFMNILHDDYINNPKREAASKLNCYINPNIDKLIDDKFNYNLYKDASDIFGRNTNQRQFYTTPITTIPNEQGKLANWLYKTPPTCKEGNGMQCMKNNYEHLKDSNIRNGIF